MADQGIAASVITSVHNIMYLAGFWHGQPYGRYAAVVVPASGEPVLISPSIEVGRARDFTWVQSILEYSDREMPLEGATRLASETIHDKVLSKGPVGIEEDVMPVALAKELGRRLPEARVVDISEPLERLRLVKSAEEIEITRKLARLCEAAMRAFDEALGSGKPGIELAAAGEAGIRNEFPKYFPDLEYIRGRTSLWSGAKVWGHHDPLPHPLKKGDLVFQSAHPIIMGYFSTVARERFVGSVPLEVQRTYDLANEASDRCIEAIRPGVTFSEIDAIADRVFDRAGLAHRKGFGVGHSHGLMGPFWGRESFGEFRPYNHTILEEGMITSMEPSLFIPGVGRLFTNDMILVAKDGAEVISNYPRELKQID